MAFADGIEQNKQPYKYNGKELDSDKGLNLYDYSARYVDPALGRFTTMDPLAEKYYAWSPYAYCKNNPVNAIDPDGKVVVFINGMHAGSGGKAEYWGGFDKKVMRQLNDYNPHYVDGSYGGKRLLPKNLSVSNRMNTGYTQGKVYAHLFLHSYRNRDGTYKESIKVITHSMGLHLQKDILKD